MPLLSCTARTCLYNKNEYCSKGDIQVDGPNAQRPDETCCKSFVEKKRRRYEQYGNRYSHSDYPGGL